MKVVIFGASGATGHELVRHALNRGHIVKAFVRNSSKLLIRHTNLFVVEGELSNYTLIEEIIKGQDAVLSALGSSSPFKFDHVVVDGLRRIMNVMDTVGVRRFIYLSFVGVAETRENAGLLIRYVAPRLLSTEIARHEAVEEMLRRSDLEWTIVRAPTLTNRKPKKRFRTGEYLQSTGIAVTISRADVADFMIQQLETTSYVKKSPTIMC